MFVLSTILKECPWWYMFTYDIVHTVGSPSHTHRARQSQQERQCLPTSSTVCSARSKLGVRGVAVCGLPLGMKQLQNWIECRVKNLEPKVEVTVIYYPICSCSRPCSNNVYIARIIRKMGIHIASLSLGDNLCILLFVFHMYTVV